MRTREVNGCRQLAVHHLDLRRELDLPGPPAEALHLTRLTLQALAAGPLPASWPDDEVVLLGTGRLAPSADDRATAGAVADRLPLLG
jgi:hypothetical protein